VPTERAIPVATPDTEQFWEHAKKGELAIQRCASCSTYIFYPRSHCPFCFADEVPWVVVSGLGTLHSYVISHRRAPGFEPPYVIAIVALDEGPRMMSNIVGVEPIPEALQLDMRLAVVFEEQGGMAIPRFTPVEVIR